MLADKAVESLPPTRGKQSVEPKIQIDGISKIFGDTTSGFLALQDVNLTVNENEFLAIVGPSGCGKSTLLHMVAGFIPITAGDIRIAGHLISGPGPDRGVVFQDSALLPWRTVSGNILLALEARNLTRSARMDEAQRFLVQVGLEGFENFFPKQLSGGMRQRVSIARTLALDPEVLLMDEPFAALDSQTRILMQQDLLKLWRKQRKTVLFVTHDVREAVYLAGRVVVMSAKPGRIKAIIDTDIPDKGAELEPTEQFSRKCNEIWHLLRAEITPNEQ